MLIHNKFVSWDNSDRSTNDIWAKFDEYVSEYVPINYNEYSSM